MKNKTKIIATIGPASYDKKVLKKMKKNGMDIMRLNTKHIKEKKFNKVYPVLKEIGLEILVDIKDIGTIFWIKKYDFDYLAVSFASTGTQIKKIRKLIDSDKIKIISKIENKKGLRNFESIIKESDGIMIARGDLSKNVSFEKIPVIQKEIIAKSRKKRKMVITATEMLHSMTHSKSPKKSEVSDIANAVFEGSNALMLSEETAIGKYPALAVKTMDKIIKEAEKSK